MKRHLSVIALGFAAFTLAQAAPPNDDCAGAIVIPSVPFTSAPVDITDATPQDVNEGLHTCAAAGGDRTIWYSFTPEVSGGYRITTCPASGATGNTVYDTIISVFESSDGSCPQAAQLACDDNTTCESSIPDAPYVDQGTIVTSLTAGTTYFIVAGHYAGDTGGVAPGFENLVIHVGPPPAPPNDTCDSPTPLSLNRVTQGTTLEAENDYRSPGDATCFSGIGQTATTSAGRDVVFSFLPPADGKYSFHYVQDDSAAALRSQNPALYLSHDCPASAPNGPVVPCIKGANRIAELGVANGNRSEEIDCVPLAAGEQVYLYFDDRVAGNPGGPFAVEVTECLQETEPNDAIDLANPYPGCGLEGAANPTADVDFFDLGAPPAGSKVFLGIDAVAANDGDFELRLTNATDTLGYDDDDGSSWISANAPVIAGPFADGSELYARVNKGSNEFQLTASEPYRLYARFETGIAQEEVDTPSNASYYFANVVTGGGFVAGVMETIADQDCFRFVASEGDNIALFSDNNPTRTEGTITNVWPIIRDLRFAPPTASIFFGQVLRNSVAASPGTLTGLSPSVTSEFANYRARYTGTYMACYATTTDNTNAANPPASAYPLPYQGSISLNCGPIPAPASRVTDVGVTKTGPAGPVNTGDIIEYTITLTNLGDDIAEDVRLIDVLPPDLVFVGLNVNDGFNGNNVGCIAAPTPGTNDNIIDCTNFSIAPGASTVFTLQAQVVNCIGAGIEFANTASITTLSTDPNVVNDSATWTLTTTETGSCNDLLCDDTGCIVNHCTASDHCEAGVCISPDVDCNDDNLCTEDSCEPSDDDGDPCIHDPNSINSCPGDGNDCTLDACDPEVGCIFPPAPAGTACDDSSSCTTGDACDGNGVCVGVSPCDDGLPCTDDFADPNNDCTCLHPITFPGSPCDDGSACTQFTTCDGVGGTADHCIGGKPVDCNDSNPCTDDSCDPANGCVHTDNANPCSDGDACTSGDACGAGTCNGGEPVDCNDGNPCTDDSCDPASGCVHTDNANPCSDGDACTTGDACGGGTCNGGGPVDCNDSNPCTDDSCDPSSGCVHTNNTNPCSDGDACTTGDACGGGTCNGGGPVDCNDSNPCTDDSCDPSSGCVHTNNTNPCSDGDACTTGDACGGGTCNGGGPADCNDGNPCTDDSCDPSSGCVHTDNTNPCSDGNACTTGDACGGGTCHGGAPLVCSDGNGCTDDSCNPSSGCVYANNTAPCSDGNACTIGDTCNGGACGGGAPVSCVASDQCHVAGTCDPGSGVCSNPVSADGSPCDDGDSGTSNDACHAGTCVGSPVCHSTDDPKTRGFYNSLCAGGHGHSGDALTDADAVCVASITTVFGAIHTASDICAVFASGNQGGGDNQCAQAEEELMALALNICKQRVCPSQGVDSECGTSARTVGEALAGIDAILSNPGRTSSQCRDARCQAKEINNGHALELDSLILGRQTSAIRLSWDAPILDDGTGAPAGYKVWRRPASSLVPFTHIGTTTRTTFLDTSAGTGAWVYNLTPITP